MTSFLQLIPRLREARVEFVIIGGVAAIFHGVENATMNLDVVAPMRLESLQRLISALAEIHPKFRMRPDLPVVSQNNPNLKGIRTFISGRTLASWMSWALSKAWEITTPWPVARSRPTWARESAPAG